MRHTSRLGIKVHGAFTYQQDDDNQLSLKGTYKDSPVELNLRMAKPSSFKSLSHKIKLITGEIKRVE